MGLSPQLRKARELLAWSLTEASTRSGLSEPVIERAEEGDGAPDIVLTELARLQATFEDSGVVFGFDGSVAKRRRSSGG